MNPEILENTTSSDDTKEQWPNNIEAPKTKEKSFDADFGIVLKKEELARDEEKQEIEDSQNLEKVRQRLNGDSSNELESESNKFIENRDDNKAREIFIRANELLSYGIEENNIHIHITPEKGFKVGVQLLRDGLSKLARIAEGNKQIKEIAATSWIIANNPKILEMLGFTIDGEINEKMRQAHFADETRNVWKAHMDRNEFLKKYLKIET